MAKTQAQNEASLVNAVFQSMSVYPDSMASVYVANNRTSVDNKVNALINKYGSESERNADMVRKWEVLNEMVHDNPDADWTREAQELIMSVSYKGVYNSKLPTNGTLSHGPSTLGGREGDPVLVKETFGLSVLSYTDNEHKDTMVSDMKKSYESASKQYDDNMADRKEELENAKKQAENELNCHFSDNEAGKKAREAAKTAYEDAKKALDEFNVNNSKADFMKDYVSGTIRDNVSQEFASDYLQKRTAITLGNESTKYTDDFYRKYAESVIKCSLSNTDPNNKLPTKEEVEAMYEFLENDPYNSGYSRAEIEQELKDEVAATLNKRVQDVMGLNELTANHYLAISPSKNEPGTSTPSTSAPSTTTPSTTTHGNSSKPEKPENNEPPKTKVVGTEEKTVRELIEKGDMEAVYRQLTGANFEKEPADNLYLPDSMKDAMSNWYETVVVDGGSDSYNSDLADKDLREELLKWCDSIGVSDMKVEVQITETTKDGRVTASGQRTFDLPPEAKAAAQSYRQSEGNHMNDPSHDQHDGKAITDNKDPNYYTKDNIAALYQSAGDDARKIAELDYDMANAINKGVFKDSKARVEALGDQYNRIQMVSVNGMYYNGLAGGQTPGTPGYENAINHIMTDNVVYDTISADLATAAKSAGKSMTSMWSTVENVPAIKEMRDAVMSGKETIDNVKQAMRDEKTAQRAALAELSLGTGSSDKTYDGPSV